MDRKDWNRIGLVAAALLVPGGFLLGATVLARRAGKEPDIPAPAEDPAAMAASLQTPPSASEAHEPEAIE